MFLKKTKEPTPLDIAIEDVFSTLRGLDESEDEYAKAVDQLVKLMKLKKEIEPSWQPSPDALLAALANVTGILLILNHERLHVIATRAIGFIGKLR